MRTFGEVPRLSGRLEVIERAMRKIFLDWASSGDYLTVFT